jgi:pimeloyl-ACP methyl ester carboxylesterase
MTPVGGPTFVPSSDGVRVAVHDLGGPDDPAATVLLFAHATGLCGQVWKPVAASLARRFRCLAIDFRGHGMSEMPPGAGVAWPRMGDDVDAVLRGVLVAPRARVHGIGHSMGGAALVLAAARRRGPFRSLWLYEPVIVGPGVLPPMDAPNPMAEAAARRKPSFGSFEEAISNFAVKPPLNQLHADALEAYVRGGFVEGADGRVTLRCAPATEAAVFRGAADSGAWDLLPSLDVPVAVVAGRNEEAGPVAFVPAALAQLQHGTFVDRPRLGHFGPLEDPSGAARDVTAWVDATDAGKGGPPS